MPDQPDYLDFNIEIGLGEGRDYPVRVDSEAGQARHTMRFPFDELALGKSLAELEEALALGVDRIMLDNMDPGEMRQAVEVTAGRVPLEASGNVTLDNVAAIAATGVDYISVGALTHSVKALDISLEVEGSFGSSTCEAFGPSLSSRPTRSHPRIGFQRPGSGNSTA